MSTVNLKTVAKTAGVSVSVASRALNGRAREYRISDATEQRVKACADRLGFRHSEAARSFRLQKTGLVGVVVPDMANPFFALIARSITLQSEPNGHSVIVADSREETEHEVRLLRQLEDRRVEGLVVCPVGKRSDHLVEIQKRGTPVILADRTFSGIPLSQVTTQHYTGATRAMRLLTDRGHRVISALQGLPETSPNEERLRGYRDVVRTFDCVDDPALILGNNFTEASGYHSAKTLLSTRPDVTALFAFSVPNAMGAMRAAMELGRRVPDDLSLVAFDDSPYADFMAVPLTTVRQDVDAIGQAAAKLLHHGLSTKRGLRVLQRNVGVKVVRRQSIAPPKCPMLRDS